MAPKGPFFFTTKIVPLSGETYFLGPILVILAKMSAFGPFWEPDFYVSSLKGTIFVDILDPFLSGRTDGHTDVTNGRTSDFLDSLHNSPFGATNQRHCHSVRDQDLRSAPTSEGWGY